MIFNIEGDFVNKPILKIDGIPVEYASLNAYYYPGGPLVADANCNVSNESVGFSFSLKERIGNLEVGVSYRVVANKDNKLVLAVEQPQEQAVAKVARIGAIRNYQPIVVEPGSYRYPRQLRENMIDALINNEE